MKQIKYKKYIRHPLFKIALPLTLVGGACVAYKVKEKKIEEVAQKEEKELKPIFTEENKKKVLKYTENVVKFGAVLVVLQTKTVKNGIEYLSRKATEKNVRKKLNKLYGNNYFLATK